MKSADDECSFSKRLKAEEVISLLSVEINNSEMFAAAPSQITKDDTLLRKNKTKSVNRHL